MREKVKAGGKKKSNSKKGKAAPVVMEEADSRITLMIQAIMTPEVSRIDGELANVVSSLKEVSAQSGGYENKVMAAVEGMFRSFKTEMMGSFARVNKQVPSQTHQHTAGGEGFEDVPLTGKTNSVARDGNDDIIDNVMANISHYSTPPDDEHDNYVSVLALETSFYLLVILHICFAELETMNLSFELWLLFGVV